MVASAICEGAYLLSLYFYSSRFVIKNQATENEQWVTDADADLGIEYG